MSDNICRITAKDYYLGLWEGESTNGDSVWFLAYQKHDRTEPNEWLAVGERELSGSKAVIELKLNGSKLDAMLELENQSEKWAHRIGANDLEFTLIDGKGDTLKRMADDNLISLNLDPIE